MFGKMFVPFIHLLNLLEKGNNPPDIHVRKQPLVKQMSGQEKRLQRFGRIFSRFELFLDVERDSFQQLFLLRLVDVFVNTNADLAFPRPEFSSEGKMIIN